MTTPSMHARTYYLAAAVIVLAAFCLREWFVLTMIVPEPNQGDVGAYLRYALNLSWHGVFGESPEAIPDAFRSPGYPWLLWSVFPGEWESGAWFRRVYQLQAVLGAATVAGTIALARQFMARGFALAAGAWMALQPHNIAATGALLSEVLFGALVVGALLAWSHAAERRSLRLGVVAGVAMGLGYLTNPVIACLPFILAALAWRSARAPALAMVCVSALAIGGWSARNALVEADGGARAEVNFVQGSWPQYHDAHKWNWRWPATWKAINDEIALVRKDRSAGLARVFERMSADPGQYAAWYASKPYLLFDWEVRIGHGMVYVVEMRDTALHRGVLLGTTVIQWRLNAALFALALAGLVAGIVRGGTWRMVAVSVLYLSAVHVVLQAEPRYSIPYRSLEIALAFGMLAWLRRLLPD